MVKRGAKAMQRSLRKKKDARKRYLKYTSQYEHLSRSGDKRMHKARREANKARENWMVAGRLDRIPEDEEPQEDPPEPPDEIPGPEPQGVQEPYQGKVRRLTDFYNKIGGPRVKAPITPKTPGKTASLPSGGVKKTRKRERPKLEEPQRLKLELAMRNFLKKKPPD